MIKATNLLKIYNADKPNEISAINNVSLELPDKGLVVILGKSGCGKTTLMNCLGGLDSIQSGTITIGNETFTRYDSRHWDAVRNANIGYIFQNYNLINNITVQRNVELGLEIAGMTDRTEIRRRAQYALNVVGMLKFKNRLPTALSGGQQQRVGIARALAKAPSVIFADEPTGNLDDKNTLAIMDILKGLSEHCLVVLVTHERNIAGYYADRIINIFDGSVVSDEKNSGDGTLRHKASNEIYLGDLQSQRVEVSNKIALKLYADKPIKSPIELSVVYNDGQLYVRADTDIRVRYLDENAETQLIDREYKPLSEGERKEDGYVLDIDILSPITYSEHSIFSTAKILRNWWARRKEGKQLKRNFASVVMTTFGFLLVLILAAVSNMILFDPCEDLTCEKNVIGVRLPDDFDALTYDFATLDKDLKTHDGVTKLLTASGPADGMLILGYDSNIGSRVAEYDIKDIRLMPKSLYASPKMIAGRMPASSDEVAIDSLLAERMEKAGLMISFGISSATDLLDEHLMVSDYGTWKIVGICDYGAPSVYVTDENYAAATIGWTQYEERKNGETITTKWANVYCSDKKAALKSLKAAGYTVVDIGKQDRIDHFTNALRSSSALLVIAVLLLLISLLSISKNAKSSFILRIRELGIMRAIGATKRNIMKLFFVEGIATSLVTTILGMLLCCGFLWYSLTYNLTFRQLFYLPPWLALLLLGLIGVISVFFYCLNALSLLRKTPSEILTKYDI